MTNRTFALVIGSILAILFCLAFWTFWRQGTVSSDRLIVYDVARLAQIFNKIDETCNIVSFEHQKNTIDFLNVGSFAGSEVGPLNLAYPKKWEGPYLQDNPTVQEQYYQVVQTNKGSFVVPGPGVVLANGKKIGTDIVFDKATDIDALSKDPQQLEFEGRPLAVQILVKDPELKKTIDMYLSRILRTRMSGM